jgi:UDP-N-acetylmuramate dehydrogenase
VTLFGGLEHIVREQESLAPYTWFRLGGPADYFAEPATEAELTDIVKRCYENEVPVRLLGGGSNILVAETGFSGLVLHLSAAVFSQIEVTDCQVRAGGGAKLAHLVSAAVGAGLAGLEQLAGIPGSVGGALHGNAGTQSGDVGQWASKAVVMTRDGSLVTRTAEELRFSYRQSSLDELVILSGEFALDQDDPQEVVKRMQTSWIVKKSGQPTGQQGTGCVFKDPGGVTAASLIDQSGLKGHSVGGARVSEEHPNFILVQENATSQDVLDVIDATRNAVQEQTGLELELQIDIW